MLFTLSATAMAEGTEETISINLNAQSELVIDYIKGEKEVINENATYLQLADSYSEEIVSSQTLEVLSDSISPKDIIIEDGTGMPMSLAKTAQDFELYTIEGAILEEGGIFSINPLLIGNGECIQFRLDVPHNLDLNYDLYLYRVNLDTSELTLVDISTYSTTADFLSEGVGDINSTGGNQAYIAAVIASTGFSSTDTFTLNCSITVPGAYDVAETNDSAFMSYNIGIDLTPNTVFTLTDTNLNSEIDTDWFAINVPASALSDFRYITVLPLIDSTKPQLKDVKIEMFHAVDNTTLKKASINQTGEFLVAAGINYIKVSSDGIESFAGHIKEYALNVRADNLICTNLSTSTLNSKGTPWVIKTYDQGQRYSFFDSEEITWLATYLSPNGYKCTKVDDELYMQIENYAWSNPYFQVRKSYPTYDVIGGTAHVKMEIMPGASQVSHSPLFYDYSVFLTMHSRKFGYAANEMPVYISSRTYYP